MTRLRPLRAQRQQLRAEEAPGRRAGPAAERQWRMTGLSGVGRERAGCAAGW